MKTRLVHRVMGLTLSTCVLVTQVQGPIIVEATEYQKEDHATGSFLPDITQVATGSNATLLDQSKDDKKRITNWELDNPVGNEILMQNGEWIRFAAGKSNDNDKKPAIMISSDYPSFSNGEVSFILKPKSSGETSRFGIYTRYENPRQGAFLGYDKGGWYWQIYDGVNNPYYRGNRKEAPAAGEEVKIRISTNLDKMNVWINEEKVFSDVDLSGVSNEGGVAFRAGAYGDEITDVELKSIQITPYKDYAVKGTVVNENQEVLEDATVSVGGQKVKTDKNGNFILSLPNGSYHLTVSKNGFTTVEQTITISNGDLSIPPISMAVKDLGNVVTIQSDKMLVTVDPAFPRVVSYEYNGKMFAGQEEVLDKILINGHAVTPVVTSQISGDQVTYTMTVKDETNRIDAVLTAQLKVTDNMLEFDITDIEDHELVKTIEIPNHNLLSIKSTDMGAQLTGATMSTNTHKNGDTIVAVDESFPVKSYEKKGYMYAFVSNDDLSAGLWSNSENNVSADWQRVTQNAVQKAGYKEVGLSSTAWTYQKGKEYRKQDGTIELKDNTILTVDEMPSAKVIITDDINQDSQVDWQDGAIEYRKIMNNPTGYEKVPELVGYRISMNFGSQAQNPFLMALDGVKKVYLHTDGLGQSILLKGYGSEGHDSGHLNYADIGTRIGGAEEMKTLLDSGKQYGATFGIHVNASETYPESKYFHEDILKKNGNGSYSYGWNWIDQGININADYDLRHNRSQRFKDLYDVLGGKDNNLDFLYVDVWGNGQSGDNGTWASSQLAKEISGLGWRLGGEWGYAFENDSTFQHWAADLTYGGYSLKGINSNITRFIRNHQKDSWVGNYPAYGGAAVAPLLGGYNMKDFEGWQGRSDYNAYIKNLFEVNVPSKFIQHYLVQRMEYGNPITMTDNGETYTWTPEMMVELEDEAGNHQLVIERKSNDYAGNKIGYMSRTMTYDGKKILEGSEGDSKYLIPWNWDSNGADLTGGDEKLYHWNTKGGTTSWEVPDSWAGVSTAYVYELTELGKENMREVAIENGEMTLKADAETPYVIYQGEKENVAMNWSEGMGIIDSGFNGGNLDEWAILGQGAELVKSQGSNDMLKISGNTSEVSLTQTLTNLEPNTKYVAYIGVDNRSEQPVVMEINNGSKTVGAKAPKSIAQNYVQAYAHNTNKSTATVNDTSYFQNLAVFFETGSDVSNVSLTIKRDGGAEASYLDDIRIVKNNSNNYVSNTRFEQDFEDVAQGIWPFVVGGVEGVTDNRTHLSEKHEPYTQAGWNGKVVSDVIDGTWSVKTNGLTQRNKLVYQTIPQNFYFEPGVDYVVRFDYEAGSDGTYAVVSSDQPITKAPATLVEELPGTIDHKGAKTYAFTIKGSENGQTWFGIHSTSKAADTRGETESGQINFNGYNDFVLDNLVIEVASSQKQELRQVLEKANELLPYERNYTKESWESFISSFEVANRINDTLDVSQATVDHTINLLNKAIHSLVQTGVSVQGVVSDTKGNNVVGVEVVLVTADGKQFTTYTDKSGAYTIAGAFYGKNTISIDDNGYEDVQVSVSTKAQQEAIEQNFTLVPAITTIKGNVKAVGLSLEDAMITFQSEQDTYQVKTDANGNYILENIPVKNYEVTIKKQGYDTFSEKVFPSKKRNTIKNFMVSPTMNQPDYESDFSGQTTSIKPLSGTTSSDVVLSTTTEGKTKMEFNTGSHVNVYDSAAPAFKNGLVEANIKAINNASRFGMILRANDMNQRIYIGTENTSDKWFVEYWNGSSSSWWGSAVSGPALSAGSTVNMKVEIIDSTVKVWLDDRLVIDLTKVGMPLEVGHIGFNSRNRNNVEVSDIKVTSYDAPLGGTQVVAGRVVDQNGSPLINQSVVLKKKNTKSTVSYTATTNTNGKYRFKNIPDGFYTLELTNASIQTTSVDVVVEPAPSYIVVDQLQLGATTILQKSALRTAISRARAIPVDSYTEVSLSRLQAALITAEACEQKVDATQSEIDQARANLVEAMANLKEVADMRLLNITINAAASLSEKHYTKESFEVLKKALNEAIQCAGNQDSTQEMVDQALEVLNGAIRQLVDISNLPADNTALKIEIQIVERLMELFNQSDYTTDSWKALTDALSAAKELIKNGATQEELNEALDHLQKAVKDLTLISQAKPEEKPGNSSSDSTSSITNTGTWKRNEKGWWYEYRNGTYLRSQWGNINNQWYYFNAEGYMAEGWNLVHGMWYYLQPGSGEMKTGWIQLQGKWYYLHTDGSMFYHTFTPDGFYVGTDGVWIQ